MKTLVQRRQNFGWPLKEPFLSTIGHFRWNRGDGAFSAAEPCGFGRLLGGSCRGRKGLLPLYRIQYCLVSEAKRCYREVQH